MRKLKTALTLLLTLCLALSLASMALADTDSTDSTMDSSDSATDSDESATDSSDSTTDGGDDADGDADDGSEDNDDGSSTESNYTIEYENGSPVYRGTCGSNLTWTLKRGNEYVLTVSGTGAMDDFGSSLLPPWYDLRSFIRQVVIEDGVTSIGDYAFYYCMSLTSVTLSDSVAGIGNYAFSYTAITDIKIPDGVTYIGDYAFERSSLTAIAIPGSVTTIGKSAFSKCSSLADITLGGGVTSIGSGAFNYTAITDITFPEGVTSIGGFYGCTGLTSVIIPEGVTSINDYAFADCTSLTSIEIPTSVASIAEYAFYRCTSLAEVNYNGSISQWRNISISSNGNSYFSAVTPNYNGSTVDENGVELLYDTDFGDGLHYTLNENGLLTVSGTGSTSDHGWNGDAVRDLITEVVIKDGITDIGTYAFFGCNNLTEVTLADSVSEIGSYAFYSCGSLANIDFGAGLETIGSSAFRDCASLESVELPDGLTSIESDAFLNCTALAGITLPVSVSGIGDSAFNGCSSLTDVYYGGSLVDWYWLTETLGSFNSALTDAEIHYGSVAYDADGTEIIEIGSCAGAYSEYEVIYTLSSDGLLTISGTGKMMDGGIYGTLPWDESRDAILSVLVEDGVTGIGYYAFANCTNLQRVTLADSVSEIGGYAFYNTGITEISIPESTSIGYAAFYKASELESVTIPDSVTSISDYAFSDTAYANNSENWENGVLYIGNWLISGSVATPDRCQVRDGTIGIADMAFCDCTWVRSITIPASVIYIGTRAYGYETYSENGDVWKTTYIAHSSDTIYGYSDTAAETYADENELTFVDLNSISLLTSGDLNGDGEVDASDLTILARHVGKVETMEDETALANADVTGDGNVDASDLTKLAQYVGKIISSLD